ncbi:tail fiber domain-containing protein [Ochrobactrum sp. S46]|nr:tail fiber domain-containing protein [Ochrobactrum sp. S45]MBK0044094.1 tail fiber domain-containing protein [Ochrobactrum sp. S46]
MAVLPDYVSGTITLANGSTTVTGTGTMFQAAAFKAGDTLQIQNLTAVIASVNSNTSLTLTAPWTGTSLTNAPYRARYLPDGARVTAQTTTLIELLGNGVLTNLAELGVEDGKVPVGNAAGEYELADLVTDPNGTLAKFAALTLAARQIFQTDENGALKALALLANKFIYTDANKDLAQGDITPWAISMLGLTGTADRLAYLNAANTSALTPLTAFGRSVIGGANAAAVRTTLGLGTAATRDVGTSGSVIPVLNAQNVWSAYQWLQLNGNGPLGINLRSTGNSGTVGDFNVSPVLRLQIPRGAFEDSNGGFGLIQYEENVGTSNQLVLRINGFSANRYWQLRDNGSAYALAGSWVNSSDGRLKTDIKNIADPLEALKKLNGCTWTRLDTGTDGIGLVAQDAENAVPGCSQIIEKEKELPDGTKITDVLALDTGGVAAAVLVEACKVMIGRIEQLESRISDLTA